MPSLRNSSTTRSARKPGNRKSAAPRLSHLRRPDAMSVEEWEIRLRRQFGREQAFDLERMLVEGQVHGGVMQGAGQVFGEHAVYDRDSGQLPTASFADYFMPHAGLLQHIEVYEHAVPTPTNALGAKGVGEAGCSGSLPALVNATVDALRPLGIDHLDMPFSPARLWTAIHNVRRESKDRWIAESRT